MSMKLEEIFAARRSVRAYTEEPVSAEHIRALAEAARWAPSACNSQTWRFIAVTERETILRLCSEATRSVIPNRFMRDAPLILVGCSQLDVVANRIGTAVTGIEYHQIDMGIAMQHIVLQATELGLGTCWIGWFKEDRVRAILGIPRRVRVLAMLTVGHAADDPPARKGRRRLEEILYSEEWGQGFRA
jgi:nitroreductase